MNYDDIIDHPHYQSKKRPHMSLYDRAAQFSPFSALTGYNEAVEETAQQSLNALLAAEAGVAVDEAP